MARITIFNQSKKTEGKIRIRFRLKDGRNVQLYHKSDIEVDLSDLNKFEPDGTPKKRANYDRVLSKKLSDRIRVMQDVYDDLKAHNKTITAEQFETGIEKVLYPDRFTQTSPQENEKDLVKRFEKYISDGSFAYVRTKEYKVMGKNLQRFLVIFGLEGLKVDELNPAIITDLQIYLFEEYKYAALKKWKYLFKDIKKQNYPKKESKQNTVQSKLKMLKAFYAALEESDEVAISPFRKLGKTKRAEMLREEYNAPISLRKEEIKVILNTDVPETLKAVKDTFLLQCALGCRIADYQKMNMEYLRISEEGIPYITYVAGKTGLKTETPLVRFAFEILKRTNFNLPLLKYVSGEHGYNKKIKELMKHCQLDRAVEVGREGTKILYEPLHSVVSSKTARKTNVTLCNDAQIDKAFMGLHERGSKAILNYDDESIVRKFKIACIAFDEETYQIDKELNVI